MEALPTVLLLLACPVGMGLMMWFMMRGHGGQAQSEPPRPAQPAVTEVHPEPRPADGARRFAGLCLNWKVVGVLAAVGIGIGITVPNLLLVALPVLALLVCPLSMLLMLRGVSSGQRAPQADSESRHAPAEPTCSERLGALRTQLVELKSRQAIVARQLAELEAASAPTQPVGDAIRSSADDRVASGA